MSPQLPNTEFQAQLISAARAACGRAYSPYSRFCVGAAVLAADHRVFAGCNVENASYGLAICAERVAVFHAVASGIKSIKALAVYTPTPTPTAPCGACRQVLREFASDMDVVCVCDGPGQICSKLSDLLPQAFGPENLA